MVELTGLRFTQLKTSEIAQQRTHHCRWDNGSLNLSGLRFLMTSKSMTELYRPRSKIISLTAPTKGRFRKPQSLARI
jgi:hypothetical protein